MSRTKSLIGKIMFIGVCAAALGGCYYAPAPGYYAAPAPAPAYYGYYGPPVYGSVFIGGGGHDHWR